MKGSKGKLVLLFYNRATPLPRHTEAAKRRGLRPIDARATNRSTRSWRGLSQPQVDEENPVTLDDLVNRLVHCRRLISRDYHYKARNFHQHRGTLKHFGSSDVDGTNVVNLLANHCFLSLDQG